MDALADDERATPFGGREEEEIDKTPMMTLERLTIAPYRRRRGGANDARISRLENAMCLSDANQ